MDQISEKRRQKIESRMSEQDLKEAQQMDQAETQESQYKLIQQIKAKQSQYNKGTIYVAILVSVVTALFQLLGKSVEYVGSKPQLGQIWITAQMILLIIHYQQTKKLDKRLNNDELSSTLRSLVGSNQFILNILKYLQLALTFFSYFKNVVVGLAISQVVFILIISIA
ncbi:unnamed protein product (macronuclear) [Paramecium tetraurelia]|uniref:Transmembrane protein n=1 Tax=Paramecium tetraurelia TaxID=5888 RepID=A0DI18_PARTE|nr:uncharacterized protein GSPATT00017056001 [Paramecium tetraurelia]CAK82685.1 unnamed protein product [Paramecium tetraurelia]|eukprot:XP_001450082.1 hypothetical protein (macronuclear) [Paramecium tetraurelia strain d4-2]